MFDLLKTLGNLTKTNNDFIKRQHWPKSEQSFQIYIAI